MGGRAGSSDLSFPGRVAVMACGVSPVLGIEERRAPDSASRGGGVASAEPETEAGLGGSGGARRAGPDPAQGVAGAPDRHPGNAAALAPPHGHQEVDPAQGPGTPATGRRAGRADRQAGPGQPALGRGPGPRRATPPRAPDRRWHHPQDLALTPDTAPGSARRLLAHLPARTRRDDPGGGLLPHRLRSVADATVRGIRHRAPNAACAPAGCHPFPDRGLGHATGPRTHCRPGRCRAWVHPSDPGPGRQLHRRVRRRVSGRWLQDCPLRRPGAADETSGCILHLFGAIRG